MEILYEDENVIAVNKPCGILSQRDASGDDSVEERISDHIGFGVYILYRLDRAVGGVLLFAKNKRTASEISAMISERKGFYKEYLAVISCLNCDYDGVFEDFLFKDGRTNKVFAVKTQRKGSKFAKLRYRVIEKKDEKFLVSVIPETGRTHQIRVQFASRKMPLVGDGKYGSRIKGSIGLFAHKIEFEYPKGNIISVLAKPEGSPFDAFLID